MKSGVTSLNKPGKGTTDMSFYTGISAYPTQESYGNPREDCVMSIDKPSNYSVVMKRRWELSNKIIPDIDMMDIFNEHPNYKKEGSISFRH